jgi:signal transduction histidine kinase
MTVAKMLGEMTAPELAWDFMRYGMLQRCLALAGFGVALGLLIILGYGLRDQSELLTLIWPASGLLFMALWTSPGRNWIWIVAVQWIVQFGIYLLYADRVNWQWGPLFAVANSIDGVVGAVVARRLIRAPSTPDIRQVLLFLAAIALGAASSALIGAFASIHTSVGTHFLRQWQLWWAGTWLGSLFVAPVVLSWAVRFRSPEKTARPPAAADLFLTGGALLGITYWTFSSSPAALSSIFQSPVLVLALAIVAAFRLPPRWATVLTALSVLIAAYYSSRHWGPYAIESDPFTRIGRVQLNLAALIVIDYMLVIVLFEVRSTVRLLRQSEQRYRNFVEKSTEAVWQIELTVPMAFGLDLEAQIEWLRKHAYVDECNLAYRQLNEQIGVAGAEVRAWRPDAPWSVIYLDHLEQAARQGYSIDGLQFSVASGAGRKTFLTGFTGVIKANKLESIWGVARDITQLIELNESLKQKQARVQMYARQLTSAEERARRATAVDLHDGIGQQLTGLALTLEAAAAHSQPEVRLLLSEATHTLRQIHAITQRVIADLSPPGLYELGLEAALQWLSVYMRGRDGLQLDLQISVDDSALDLELRILAFKLIRELLRNVVKHSGAKAAKVAVTMTSQELFIDVVDQGVGFEWQLSLFETREGGFGLWSVAERVREAAGELTVDTAPGQGCSVSVTLPLKRHDESRHSVSDIGKRGTGRDGSGNSAANFDTRTKSRSETSY